MSYYLYNLYQYIKSFIVSCEPQSPQTPENTLEKNEIAIFKLKTTRDKVKSVISVAEKKQKSAKERAKEYLKQGNREKAKNLLHISKLNQVQIDSSNGMLMMIYEQIHMLETSSIQSDVAKVLEDGNKTLLKIQEEFTKLDELKEDMDLARQNYKEIQSFLQENNYSESQIDDEVEKEFLKLQEGESSNEKNTDKKKEELNENEDFESVESKNEEKNIKKKEAIAN